MNKNKLKAFCLSEETKKRKFKEKKLANKNH